MQKLFALLALGIIITLSLSGCAGHKPDPRGKSTANQGRGSHGLGSQGKSTSGSYREEGVASWYGAAFQGKKTANGEKFDMNKLTAAHKKLPFGSLVRVTNLSNGKSVQVRINDRGPFVKKRIIDLSRRGAEVLDMIRAGTVLVRVEGIGF
jgi:rare lipoprotein A